MRGRRVLLRALTGAVTLAAAPAAGAAVAPPVRIDGPSSAIVSLDGVALAQDGSGAVVYRKMSAGVAHVFAVLESAGAWGAPAQVDGGLGAAASAALAVSNGGRVAISWISGGTLYGTVHAAGSSSFSAPQAIAAASGTPALAMGVSGTAYVAFLAPAGTASNVEVARLDRHATAFAVLSGPLNAVAVTAVSAGGPSIAVSADATAVVAWAQHQPDASTHVFVRRVSAAGPSPISVDATVATLGGAVGGSSADSPVVGIADDSSYAWVAFRETFGAVSRVVVTGLLGDELRTPFFADSLGGASATSSALAPSLVINGNDAGLLASELTPSNGLAVAALGTPGHAGGWTPGAVVNTAPAGMAPGPVAALSGAGNGVVAYASSAGVLDGVLFAAGAPSAPLALSNATFGPLVAADGLRAGADDGGDLLVGFVAGSTSALSVVVTPIVLAPGAPRATGTQLWVATKRPVLRWQPSKDSWAPPTYSVYIDAKRVATTTKTAYPVPADLREGRHTWKVVAIDGLGQEASSATRRLLINGGRPALRLLVGGPTRAGAPVSFTVAASALSGVRRVSVDYGDGHSSSAAASTHAYASAGHYTVTVTVTDRAGVSAQLSVGVSIS